MSTLANELQKAVVELSTNVIEHLDAEQRAALESKFNALPDEVRSASAVKYPNMTIVGMYIVRQMVKEANGKLASNRRPIWYLELKTNAKSLKSGDEAVRAYGQRKLEELADSIDSKESTTLLKKYKVETDQTTASTEIQALCSIFGISPATLK